MKGCWLHQCDGKDDCEGEHDVGLMGSSRAQAAGDVHNKDKFLCIFFIFIDVDFVLISLIHPAGVPSICPHHRYQKSSQGSYLHLMVHGLDT